MSIFLRKSLRSLAFGIASFLPKPSQPLLDAKPIVETPDRIDEIEIDTVCMAAPVSQAAEARYNGLRVGVPDQLDALTHARGKGQKYLNLGFGGATQALQSFISARTKDL